MLLGIVAGLLACNSHPASPTTSAPASSAKETIASFTLPSGAAVRIVEAPFVASLFKVNGCSEQDSKCLINDAVPFGVAFGLPESYVKSIVVSFSGHSHSLDVSNMFNAWGTRPLEVKGVIRYFGGKCWDADNCQLRGLFSDAAGTFVVQWSVVDSRQTRTVITASEDVVDLFEEHIDPPEFQ